MAYLSRIAISIIFSFYLSVLNQASHLENNKEYVLTKGPFQPPGITNTSSAYGSSVAISDSGKIMVVGSDDFNRTGGSK